MPTTAEPRTQEQYVDFDEFVDFQLKKTRANIKLTDILTAATGAATLVLGYLLIFTILDHWVIDGGFGTLSRSLLFGLLMVATTAWLYWRIAVPYLKNVTGLFAARVLEESDPSLKSTLLNLVDLQRAGRDVPDEIRTALEKRAALSLSHMDVDHAVDRRLLMRFAYTLLVLVCSVLCLHVVFPEEHLPNPSAAADGDCRRRDANGNPGRQTGRHGNSGAHAVGNNSRFAGRDTRANHTLLHNR